MPRLRCSGALGGIRREGVALQHDDVFEIVGERARRRQTGHTGTDHHGLRPIRENVINASRAFPAQSLTTRLLGLVLNAAAQQGS